MKALYELNHLINEILENDFVIDEETGEVLLDADSLDQLDVERSEKIDNIACFIKDQVAYVEALKAEKKKLDERIRVANNKAEWLKNYLQVQLDGEKFTSARVAISYRKSESVEVADVYKVPEDYLRYKEPEVNKTELKKAIKAGKTFEGVELITKTNMQIK